MATKEKDTPIVPKSPPLSASMEAYHIPAPDTSAIEAAVKNESKGGDIVNPVIEAIADTSKSKNSDNPATPTSQTLSASENIIYSEYEMMPQGVWPPPIFVRKSTSPQERYYMEHRWHSQWAYFDKQATMNKNRYLRLQLIIGVGSVTVPVLVGINPVGELANNILYVLTVVTSLLVAISAAIENINKYGDYWRSYRQAAEELKQEKHLYDVLAGRYANIPDPFSRFVERCEEVMAQQNGRWIQSMERQQQQADQQTKEVLDQYRDKEEPHTAG